jgi:hypothetical protein
LEFGGGDYWISILRFLIDEIDVELDVDVEVGADDDTDVGAEDDADVDAVDDVEVDAADFDADLPIYKNFLALCCPNCCTPRFILSCPVNCSSNTLSKNSKNCCPCFVQNAGCIGNNIRLIFAL